jgi:hypothetical protein
MSDLERRSMQMPGRMSERDLPERYHQPSALTQAGQLDRRHEGKHVVRMRDLQRQAIEAAAEQAKQEFETNAWLECRSRALSEAKYRLLRNHKESAFLAEEDPVLQAEFGILDDEYFRDLRLKFNGWDR